MYRHNAYSLLCHIRDSFLEPAISQLYHERMDEQIEQVWRKL